MTNNGIQIENSPNILIITDSDQNQITVTQPVVSLVEVSAVGPQGQKGDQGDSIFQLVSGSVYSTTSSLEVSGSFTVSGSSTFKNIGPAIFSGSVTSTQGFTGSLFGSSSYALTASYAMNGGSGGGGFYIATGSVSASVGLTTGSFVVTSGSSTLFTVNNAGAISASAALITGNVVVQGTASINTLIVNQTQLSTGSNQLGDAANDFQTLYGTVTIPTGSLTVTGSIVSTDGFTGSLFGTSSFANTASYVNPLRQTVIISGSTSITGPSTGGAGVLNINGTTPGTTNGDAYIYFNNSYLFQHNQQGGSFNFKQGSTYIWNSRNGNLLVGNTGTAPSARLHVLGSGTTSATTALLVQNSNASSSLVVLDSGYVGINTGSAAYNLDVNGTGRYVDTIRIAQSGFLRNADISMGTSLTIGTSHGGIQFYYQSNNIVNFGPSNNQFFKQTQIGYGTSLITRNAVLSVGGTITASSSLAQGLLYDGTLAASASNDTLVGLDINPTFTAGGFTGLSNIGTRVQNGGLLIGTTLLNTDTLSFPLQINGSSQNIGSVFRNALSTGYTSFRFYNDQNVNTRAMEMGYAGSAYPSAIVTGGVTGESAYLTSTGAYPLQLGTNNTARFIVFSNGNIGINTSTDSGAKLTVKGTGTTSATTALSVQNSNASSSLVILDSGQVGIGVTNPTGSLTTNGNIQINNNGGLTFYNASSIFSSHYITTGNEVLTATSYNSYGAWKFVGYNVSIAKNLAVGGVLTDYVAPLQTFLVSGSTVLRGNTAITGSTTITGSLAISGSSGNAPALTVYKSGSTVMSIQGSQGELFSITDSLSGSLFSVSNISGLPIVEVFSDDSVVMGNYATPAMVITGSVVNVTGSLVTQGQTMDPALIWFMA